MGYKYKYRSRRQVRKLASSSKRNFLITLFLVALLLYGALIWILPQFINGISFVKNAVNPEKKVINEKSKNSSLPPPVLSIPFEATNTAEINIRGYGTPNSKLAIYLDDEKKETVEISEDGTFEFKNISLVLGINNIYGKSIDEENLESLSSKNIQIIFDNEEPALTIKEPEDDKKIQGGDKKIKITGNTEADSQIFINDSQAIVDKDGNFSSEQSLNDGENTFNIKALDKASNFTEVSRKVTYQP